MRCKLQLASGLEVTSLFAFEGPVRRVIIDWKEEGRRSARARVIQWLEAGLAPLLMAQPDRVLVPVPSSSRADRYRGGALLREALHSAVPHAEILPAIISARTRADQQGLSRSMRARNMHESMLAHAMDGRPALLVDDILTTGATLRECARAIWAQGTANVSAFTIARRS